VPAGGRAPKRSRTRAGEPTGVGASVRAMIVPGLPLVGGIARHQAPSPAAHPAFVVHVVTSVDAPSSTSLRQAPKKPAPGVAKSSPPVSS
jgi:hypothetical protein